MSDKGAIHAGAFEVIRFEKGETIFKQGETGDAAFMIREGKIEVFKRMNGNSQKLAEVVEGDVLGELALFDDRPRMATAVAMTKVTAIRISRQEFLDRMSKIDPILKSMILVMVKRVRQMADEFMRKRTESSWSSS
jgi:CRP/FNR family transcriptional regulator, cyclic AMP receptor protein